MPPEDPNPERAQMRRSVAPYLKFVRNLDDEVDLETRISHIVYEFFEDDVGWLVDALADGDATAGVSVPAIHLDDESVREGVGRLADDGHEIVAHGYRHTSYMEAPYETADGELAEVLNRFESAIGVRPTGFHVPFMRCSEGTVRAAADRGLEWIVGANTDGVDTSVSFLRPESPYDLQLFERGRSPAEVVERLEEKSDGGSLLLCHPNVHAARGATDEFAAWIADGAFADPGALADGESERPGLLLDCFPPFEVR